MSLLIEQKLMKNTETGVKKLALDKERVAQQEFEHRRQTVQELFTKKLRDRLPGVEIRVVTRKRKTIFCITPGENSVPHDYNIFTASCELDLFHDEYRLMPTKELRKNYKSVIDSGLSAHNSMPTFGTSNFHHIITALKEVLTYPKLWETDIKKQSIKLFGRNTLIIVLLWFVGLYWSISRTIDWTAGSQVILLLSSLIVPVFYLITFFQTLFRHRRWKKEFGGQKWIVYGKINQYEDK